MQRTNATGIPQRVDLLNPTLHAVHQAGGSGSIDEITELVIQYLSLPEELTNQPHGDGRQSELEYRLAWARTDLKNYGLLTNSDRGVWSLTADGQRTSEIDSRMVNRTLREAERSRRGSRQPSDQQHDDEQGDTNEDAIHWQEQLISALSEMSPAAFERLCQRLLRESGFIEVEVTGRSGDGGIDGHGIIRMGGLISFPVLFQCKRYSGSVTASTVRDFRGAMAGRSDKGLLITTGGFTRDAKQEATRDGAPPIDLIDGNLLANKLRELRLGVSTEMVERVVVDTEWFRAI